MDHEAILRELQTSLGEALRRADDRLSHVHRQLAGWQPINKAIVVDSQDDGWKDLQVSTDALAEGVESELASAHTALSELVQRGRQIKQSITTPTT
jgi:hypothetical protein